MGDGHAALARLSKVGGDPTTRLAALLADAGSPEEVRAMLSYRRLPSTTSRAVFQILTTAREAVDQPSQSLPGLRRWVVAAGQHRDQAIEVAATLGDLGSLATDVIDLLEAEPDLLGPPVLDGAEIMALLDLEPGPEVGAAVNELSRHRLESGPLTLVEARAHLVQWQRDSNPERKV